MLGLLGTSAEFDRRNGLASIAGPTRYFLYRLLCDDEGRGVAFTVQDYVERFKLNDRVVSKAIRELSESGVLQKRFVDGGLGKRRRCLELEPQLEEALAGLESEQPVVELRSLAEHVLTAIGDDIGKPGQKWLTPYNRLVLAALLVGSNSAGAVYGVGGSDLKRLAGLTDDGLRSQLSTLMQRGYLRSRVAGVTGRYLLGMSKGAYFINLAHPDFMGIGGAACFLIREAKLSSKENRYRTAFGMYNAAKVIGSLQQKEAREANKSARWRAGDTGILPSTQTAMEFERAFTARGELRAPCNLHENFRDTPSERFSRYLQMLINRYASLIVNSCLHHGGWDGNDENGELRTEIRQHLGTKAAQAPLAVVDAVVCASIHEAVRVWEVLVSDAEIWRVVMSGARCLILPLFEVRDAHVVTPIVLSGEGIPDEMRGECWKVSMLPDLGRRLYRQSHRRHAGKEQELGAQAELWGLRGVGKRYPLNKSHGSGLAEDASFSNLVTGAPPTEGD